MFVLVELATLNYIDAALWSSSSSFWQSSTHSLTWWRPSPRRGEPAGKLPALIADGLAVATSRICSTFSGFD